MLRKEVVDRLILAKSILSSSVGALQGQSNAHLAAVQILNAHDAADLVFAALADHVGKLPAKGRTPAMIECLPLLGAPASGCVGYFTQLNDARNGLKHVGNLPSTQQWSRVTDDTFERLSALCLACLGVSLGDIDELELVLNNQVRVYLSAAKTLAGSGEFRRSLEETAKALATALDYHSDLSEVQVGRPKAEDALRLTAYGIPANEFLRLQEFMPYTIDEGEQSFKFLWKQSQFGHPGNWRADTASFCIGAVLSVAVSLQNSAGVPKAIELSTLYDYRVTAKEDSVEVWEDLVDGHLDDPYADNAGLFRVSKRLLAKGETVIVRASTSGFISDDRLPSGEWIKRVRISTDYLGAVLPDEVAEFVDLSRVEITCIPRSRADELLGGAFRGLPELPWEEDSPAFSG